MKRFSLIFLLVPSLLFAAAASRIDQKAHIDSTLTSNGQGQITAAGLRTLLKEMVDSDHNLTDDGTPETPSGAQTKANAAQAYAVQRANHTGTQSADTIVDGTTNKAYTATEKTKLAAISGTNTGDQTTVSGNAGTATTLQTARQINGVSFNGSADIAIPTIRKNLILNGDMRIDQRNAGAAVSVTGGFKFPVDKFKAVVQGGGSGVLSFQRLSASPPTGASYYVRATVTTASASPSAGHAYYYFQFVEGRYIDRIPFGVAANGQSVTLSFKVRSSLTGTFSGVLSNGTNARTYVFTYAISAANTWEAKSVTIPVDTTGTWAIDNSAGLFLSWDLGAGTTYTNATSGWQAATILKATGSVSLIATNAATWDITDVQLESGTVATEFERSSFPDMLALCQREYCKSFDYGTAPAQSTGSFYPDIAVKAGASTNYILVRFPVPMRAAPGFTFYNPSAANGQARDLTANADCSAASGIFATENGFVFSCTGNASTAVGNLLGVGWVADASL